jgi:hypothetical protein
MMTTRAMTKAPSAREGESRAILLRHLRQEAALESARADEARRAAELAIEAKISLQVQGRIARAIAPLVSRLEAHLRDELREAARAGDNGRRMLIEAEIDALFRDLNQAMRAEAGR